MTKKIFTLLAIAAITAGTASATAIEDFCGNFNVNLSVLDLGPFGNAGEDWTPVFFDEFRITVTSEGNTLTFENLFPMEEGSLRGEYDPETSSVVFQPQTIGGKYTFCGYPTGDWWENNKLTEDPTTCSAKIVDGNVVFDMWSIVDGIDVMATNYYSTTLTPEEKEPVTAEMLAGTYIADPFMVLDLEPFGSVSEDWSIVDLSNHQVVVSADGDELTFTGFFPYEGGDLRGKFDAGSMTVTFEPQTIMKDYIFCAYPTGDWWENNQLTEDPAPMTATINADMQFVFSMWSMVKGIDVVATNYTSGILTFFDNSSVKNVETAPASPAEVYNLNGIRLRSADSVEDALEGLPAGLYIVNGKKYLLK